MDAKLAKLVEIMCEEDEISPAELAERLEVSIRTVRTYVGRVNRLLSNAGRIEMRSSSVYKLEDADKEHLSALLDSKNSPSIQSERVSYLMNDLLYRNDWITIDDLASILFVSHVTVSEDLKLVERQLARFDLRLERRPRYGIRVNGEELKRRLCLATLATNSSVFDTAAPFAVTRQGEILQIDECLSEGMSSDAFQINAFARQNLLVHIAVALSRIRMGCYVPMEREQLEHIRATREFSVAGRVADAIERRFGLTLPETEVAYIAIHLAGRQRLLFPADAPENELVISDEVWDVVTNMVDRVWEAFRFDFRDDLELRMNLAQHVVPLSVRLKFHLRMDNPLLSDIKHHHPLAWTMAVEASAVLADAYDSHLSEEEIGYLALAFALALERKKGMPVRKNILIVCASGAGSARLLESRYRQEFSAYLDRIETCDVAGVDSCDFTDIDYVFTTVPLGRTLSVPVREVGFFLNEKDLHHVRKVLEARRSESGIDSYFDERLFFPHLVAADKDEVLDTLCSLVGTRRAIPDDFVQLVRERERAAPTSFGNRVSMPHPARPCTPDTFVAVGLLDKPVLWAPDVLVSAVFLVSVSMSTDKNLQDFYDRMARLLVSKEDVEMLIKQREFTTLLELLNR